MGRGAAWTEQDDAILLQHFGKVGRAEMRRLLGGRTTHAIYDRVKKLRDAGRIGHVKPQRRPGKPPTLFKPPRTGRKRAQVLETHREVNIHEHLFAPATVTTRGPAHLPGEPVITERTRIVRVPAPVDKRYATDEAQPVVDATQCRAWALHATREGR